MVTWLEPSSKGLDLCRGLCAQDMLPHGVHNTDFALVEASYLSAEDAVEVERSLMYISEKFDPVVKANVADQYEEIVEGVANLAPEIFTGHEKGIATQKERNR